MKISIVYDTRRLGRLTWELARVREAAKKRGIMTEVIQLETIHDVQSQLDHLGEIVVWNSAGVRDAFPDQYLGRSICLDLLKGRVIIGENYQRYPFIGYKIFQQQVVAPATGLPAIPTWHWRTRSELLAALQAGTHRLPLIVKPQVGSHGKGVRRLDTLEKVNNLPTNLVPFIFQPFIPNQGEYRVLVMGDKILGVMKRQAQLGRYRNNMQGAKVGMITDALLLAQFVQIVQRLRHHFDLQWFALDILQATSGELVFLEINNTPHWQRFQEVSGMNIAEAFLDFCLTCYDRSQLTSRVGSPTSHVISHA